MSGVSQSGLLHSLSKSNSTNIWNGIKPQKRLSAVSLSVAKQSVSLSAARVSHSQSESVGQQSVGQSIPTAADHYQEDCPSV